MDPFEDLAVLAASRNRYGIIKFLHDSDRPTSLREISSTLDIPRATVKHNLDKLEKRGIVAWENGSYHITTFGQYVVRLFDESNKDIAVARNLEPFLSLVPSSEFETGLSPFVDSDVTTVESDDPHAPVRRFSDLIERTHRNSIAVPVLVPTIVETLFEEITENRAEVELILQARPLEILRSNFPDKYESARKTGNFTVGVYDGAIPFGIALLDAESVLIGLDEKNIPRCLVENSSEDAHDWITQRFQQYRSATDFSVSASSSDGTLP